MGKMFTNLFLLVTLVLDGFANLARSFSNITAVAEETSNTYRKTAKIQGKIELAKTELDLRKQLNQLGTNAPASRKSEAEELLSEL